MKFDYESSEFILWAILVFMFFFCYHWLFLANLGDFSLWIIYFEEEIWLSLSFLGDKNFIYLPKAPFKCFKLSWGLKNYIYDWHFYLGEFTIWDIESAIMKPSWAFLENEATSGFLENLPPFSLLLYLWVSIKVEGCLEGNFNIVI